MTDTHTDEDSGQVRPFAAVLAEINHGAIAAQAATDLQALVTEVQDRGGKGSITVKFEVSQRKGGNGLNVLARVDTKMPPPPAVESVFFADADGNLLRDDPRQLQLPLRQVAAPNPAASEQLRRAGQ